MRNRIDLARIVFAEFADGYHKTTSPSVKLSWAFDDGDAERLGVSLDEIDAGIMTLIQKELVESGSLSGYAYMLTDKGREACLHPEALERYLAPKY